MAKDPVCGMKVDEDEAAVTSEHMGKTFYFCAEACKEKFEQDPMKYMKMEKKGCCQAHPGQQGKILGGGEESPPRLSIGG